MTVGSQQLNLSTLSPQTGEWSACFQGFLGLLWCSLSWSPVASLPKRSAIRGQDPSLLSLESWNLPVRGAEVFSPWGSGRDCGRWWKTLGGYRSLRPSAPPPALLSLPFLLLSSPGGPDGSHCTHALALLRVKRPSDALWLPWQRVLEPRGISIC